MASSKKYVAYASYVAFFMYACVVSSFFSRMPDLKASLVLDEKAMGLLLLSLPGGVITGSLVVSHLVDRYSPSFVFMAGMSIFSFFPLLAMNAGSLYVAYVLLFFYGLLSSTVNIAINVEAYRIEKKHSISILNRCHGLFSIGFFIFSFIAVLLIGMNVTASQQHFMMAVLVCAAMALLYFLHAGTRGEDVAVTSTEDKSRKSPVLALPTIPITLVLLYATFGLIFDGVARSWGVIYIKDLFDVEASTAASALTFLIVGISAGRFVADRAIAQFGVINTSKILLGFMLGGVACLSLTSSYIVALIGIALIGFGVSTVHPQSIRTVASLEQRTPAQNIAAFSTIQTLLMYLGPASYGVLAHYFGLRVAIICFVPLAFVAYICSRYLKK